MSNICVVNLIGIPAAGKTTFCQRFCEYLRAQHGPCNAVHIDFDDFVKYPTVGRRTEYFQSKMLKNHRFRLRWFIRELIDEIINKQTIENTLQLIQREYPECSIHSIVGSSVNRYVLLIDDNMYYKSMRKEIRTISKECGTGYLILYFVASLEQSLQRNRCRTTKISDDVFLNIATKFEIPTDDEALEMHSINIDSHVIQFEEILTIIVKSMENPLRIISEPTLLRINLEQSRLHQIDLVLRKEISHQMKEANFSGMRACIASIYCQKRKQILSDLKRGTLEMPDNFDEIRDLFLNKM